MQKRESNSRGGGLGRVVRFGTTQHHSIPYKVLKARGWREVDDDSWDFFYADVGWIHENVTYATSGNQGMKLQDHQRVNHYPNHVELTRKDLMAKNLKRSIKNAVKEGKDLTSLTSSRRRHPPQRGRQDAAQLSRERRHVDHETHRSRAREGYSSRVNPRRSTRG